MASFEEQYQDVLQNMEFAIVGVYRAQPDLLDYEVEKALNALLLAYQAEQQSRPARPVALPPLAQQVYAEVRSIGEWRLGRATLGGAKAVDLPALAPISLSEIIACLKRIRKSVQRWTQQGGRQGYLQFVRDFKGDASVYRRAPLLRSVPRNGPSPGAPGAAPSLAGGVLC